MSARRGLALVLVSVLLTLFPLAYTDLVDQIWQGGVYDGGDDDDPIVRVQQDLNAVEPLAVYLLPPVHVVQPSAELCEQVAPFRALPFRQPRAPPVL